MLTPLHRTHPKHCMDTATVFTSTCLFTNLYCVLCF